MCPTDIIDINAYYVLHCVCCIINSINNIHQHRPWTHVYRGTLVNITIPHNARWVVWVLCANLAALLLGRCNPDPYHDLGI